METNYIIVIFYDDPSNKESHYSQEDDLLRDLKYYTNNGATIVSVNRLL